MVGCWGRGSDDSGRLDINGGMVFMVVVWSHRQPQMYNNDHRLQYDIMYRGVWE